MATDQASKVIEQLRKAVLLHDGAAMTDGELLGCFIEHREDAAFAALMRRHAPMVWGVCRRLLNHHDAEDAFQATFLVLARKAASVAPRGMLPNWLYGVAHQAALHARRTVARRRARERQVAVMPQPAVAAEQDSWDDLRPLLDLELSRLPDKYRVVLVLSDLEGKTRGEAARQLGLPEGTVASRLTRARAMLAKRLSQRGVALSGGTLAAVLSQKAASAGVPSSIVSSTIKAASLLAAGQPAAGVISVKVAALTEGVLKAMLLTKLKRVAVVFVVLAMIGFGGGLYSHQMAEGQQAACKKQGQEQPGGQPGAGKAAGKEEKTSFAWGKEVKGLQAGVRLVSPVGKVHQGDYLTFEFVVRNVSKEDVAVKYIQPTGMGCSVDKPGRLVFHSAYSGGRPITYEKTLRPGQTWDVTKITLLTRRPTTREGINLWTPLKPGKYKVSCPGVLMQGVPRAKEDRLPTGDLEIELLPPQDGGEGKENPGEKTREDARPTGVNPAIRKK